MPIPVLPSPTLRAPVPHSRQVFLNRSVQAHEDGACFLHDALHTRVLRRGVEYNDLYTLRPPSTGPLWGTNVMNDLSATSLEAAITDGYRSLVTHFLQHEKSRGAQNLGACLMAAVWQENAGLVQLLLEAKADPDEACERLGTGARECAVVWGDRGGGGGALGLRGRGTEAEVEARHLTGAGGGGGGTRPRYRCGGGYREEDLGCGSPGDKSEPQPECTSDT